ncbi:DUF1841 family protein [Limnobacter litoralis]|uniref:DUF1841 domain-containing protein n=1 Tax=Limnobacter litoralis TaxID=481366 RepID=A0ABQ5YQ56_9BURK|nr:DUF1841 family protein [Limnobacter litoralis]GLR26693.1 hypothetical protein GCM10007875_17830 [Limnobacter litoralis]
MFNPTRDQARLFFLNTWKKYHQEQPLTDAESIALQWMSRHPEYFPTFDADIEHVLAKDYSVESGEGNPFLHLSMHLAVAEQISINQPPGIRSAYDKLCERLGDEHLAAHQVFECLAEQIYQQQKNGIAFDSARYINCILDHCNLPPGKA